MKISVIVASYNYAPYIRETLESILTQTYTDWEAIVVDDGSTDDSISIIQEYCRKDSRFHLYTHPDGKNHGLAATVQLGLEKATGEWIAFLESDDVFFPTSLEKKAAVVQQYPEVVLVFTNLQTTAPGKEGYLKRIAETVQTHTFPCIVSQEFLNFNLIPTFSVVMVRKDRIESCRFDSPISSHLDWFLWAQISKEPLFYIDEPLTLWRVHEDSFVNKKFPISHFYRLKWRFYQFLNPHANLFQKATFGVSLILSLMKTLRKNTLRIHLFRGEIFFFGQRYGLFQVRKKDTENTEVDKKNRSH